METLALALLGYEPLWTTAPERPRPIGHRRGKDGELVLDMELPGVSPEEVKVESESGILSISVKHDDEFRSVDISRRLSLPDDVDDGKATAALRHGVLSVTFPRKEEAKASRRAITVAA